MTMCRKESQPCYAPATLGQGEVFVAKREISVGEELGYYDYVQEREPTMLCTCHSGSGGSVRGQEGDLSRGGTRIL